MDMVHGWNKVQEEVKQNGTNRDSKYEERKRHEDKRIIEVEDEEINSEVISRSLVGEVKALCFLNKLPVLCEEQGLNKVEVKMLGGLEVMVVFDTVETANNVLKDINRGMRRWLYIEERLEGNQNNITGRIHIHMINEGLIRENIIVKVKRKSHKVSVIEEVRDITQLEFYEITKSNQEKQSEKEVEKRKDENDMVISEEEVESNDNSSSEDDDSSEDEYDREVKEGGGSNFRPATDSGYRNGGKDLGSTGTKVSETFEGEWVNSKK
ncbi:hypothetical protein Tco_0670129 [Tanacetum coccineum]